ncbi:unnamed protein product [Peniophora sp. CBMAI 1063]|nr:unnamed protein product [Peniophora sp. CBMAI 1063]
MSLSLETQFALEKLAGDGQNPGTLLSDLKAFYLTLPKGPREKMAVSRTVVAMKSLTFAADDTQADLGYVCMMHEAAFCFKRRTPDLEDLRMVFNKFCDAVAERKQDEDADHWDVIRIATEVWEEYGTRLDAKVEVPVSGPDQWWDMLDKKVFAKPSKASAPPGVGPYGTSHICSHGRSERGPRRSERGPFPNGPQGKAPFRRQLSPKAIDTETHVHAAMVAEENIILFHNLEY